MAKLTLNDVAAAARKYNAAAERARVASNAANRENTVLKNLLCDYFKGSGLDLDSEIVVDGVAYTYRVAVSEIIDPVDWYALFQEESITQEIFLGALTVRKGDASRLAGADEVERITAKVPGKKRDIRASPAPSEVRKAAVYVIDAVPKGKAKTVTQGVPNSPQRKLNLKVPVRQAVHTKTEIKYVSGPNTGKRLPIALPKVLSHAEVKAPAKIRLPVRRG